MADKTRAQKKILSKSSIEDYINYHIPHRINLLISFRERYNDNSKLKPDDIRDLFRCSKDISILMVRLLLGELGIKLKRGNDISDNQGENIWGIKQLAKSEVKSDKRYKSIIAVLKIANRAVAHIVQKDVDHVIKLDTDNCILIDAIDFTEEKVIEKMYEATSKDYKAIMLMESNDMRRKPISII